MVALAQGQQDEYPVKVKITYDSTVEEIYFADHTSDLNEGNWIELKGGVSVKIPSLTLKYSGPNSATYTRDGRTITIESTFTSKTVNYPLTSHPVYYRGDTVTAIFHGSSAFAGQTVSMRLIETSPLQVRDILSKAFKGDIGKLKELINVNNAVWHKDATLDDNGDASQTFTVSNPGDYTLIVVKEEQNPNYQLYVYSLALVEVLDYRCNVTAATSVTQGEALDINISLIGVSTPGNYRYGAALIRKDAYSATVTLTSDGTVPGTTLKGNNAVLIEGKSDRQFYIAGVGLNNVNKDVLRERIIEAFGANNVSVGFTDVTSNTSATLSLATSTSMPIGTYVLLVGVWEVGTGNRLIAFYQSEVTLVPPLPSIQLYPVQVEVTYDGSVDRILFADHTDSLTEGNWIRLTGGTSVEIPEITLKYNGVTSATYTRDGKTIKITSGFSSKEVNYPLTSHPVYYAGDTITATFYGSSSLAGETVDIRLIKTSPIQVRDIMQDAFEGNVEPLKSLLSNPTWSTTRTLDGNGDSWSVSFTVTEAGDYILAVVKEVEATGYYELRVYSATLVEVLDYNSTVIAPTSVTQGESVDITISLTGAPAGNYRYGAALIRKEVYEMTLSLTSDGTVPGTKLTGNGTVLIEGKESSRAFYIAGVGLENIDKGIVRERIIEAFGANNVSIGFSDITSATSASLSLATTGMPTGDYILLIGVWEVGTGKRLVAFNQQTIEISAPPVPPPVAPPVAPPTGEEIIEMGAEEAAEELEGLVEAGRVEGAAESLSEAAEIDLETATQTLLQMDVDVAAIVAETIVEDVAADLFIEAVVLGMEENIARVVEHMDAREAAEVFDIIAPVNPAVGAQILSHVEPETRARILAELARLPSTPDKAAAILEQMPLEKAIESIEYMVKLKLLREAGLILAYLSDERLTATWAGLADPSKEKLLPYLTVETLKRLKPLIKARTANLVIIPAKTAKTISYVEQTGLEVTIEALQDTAGIVKTRLYLANPYPEAPAPEGVNLRKFIYIEALFPEETISKPTITLHYTNSEVKGLLEFTLTIHRYDAETNIWIPVPTILNTEENTVIFTLEAGGTYALGGI
jgi:methanogen extracellular protein (TIGR04279 family)